MKNSTKYCLVKPLLIISVLFFIKIGFSEERNFTITPSSDPSNVSNIMEQDIFASNDSILWTCLECGTVWLGMYETANTQIGFRYPEVQIPPGATINSAWITTKPNYEQNQKIKIKVFGESSDFSTIFSNGNDVKSRQVTSNYLELDIIGDWQPDSLYTIQITELVKEIYNRDGWMNGNPMTFIIKDNSGLTDQNCESSEYCGNYRTINGFISYGGGSDDGNTNNFTSPMLTISYSIGEVHYAPTQLGLSNTTVLENEPQNTWVSELGTIDADTLDSHTYILTGDYIDNSFFSIVGNQLYTNTPFDYEIQNTYTINIRTIDNVGNWLERAFMITIIDVFEDSSIPTITGVSSRNADGWYGEGTYIDIIITFSKSVYVNGNPQLSLETGDPDMVVSCFGEEQNKLVCYYVVSSGNSSDDLDYKNSNALVLNGGTIHDEVMNEADLTLPLPGSTSSLGYNKSIVIDTEYPTVTLSTDSKAVTNVSPIDVTANFSEDVVNFDELDLSSFSNGVATNFTKVTDSEYTFDVIPAWDGDISIFVNSYACEDKAGNSNLSSLPLNITYDSTPPSEPFISSTITTGTTSVSPIPFTITFYESVNEFVISDIIIGNGEVKQGSFIKVGNEYSFEVIPIINGSVTVKVSTGTYSDEAGNFNVTPSNEFSINYDNVIPSATISANTGSPTNSNNILISVTFSTICRNMFLSSIVKTGSVSLSNFYITGDNSYEFTVIPLDDGEFTINIPDGVCQSDIGNINTGSSSPLTMVYDGSSPRATLSVNGNEATNSFPIPIVVSFSEDVYGFKGDDINISKAVISDFTGAGSIYSFNIIPWISTADVSISIGYGACLDAATNYNSDMQTVNIYKDNYDFWCDEKNQLEGGNCSDYAGISDYCGIPEGSNECIPQITDITVPEYGLLEILNADIKIWFNSRLTYNSIDGVRIESKTSHDLEYEVFHETQGDVDVLRIDFHRLSSRDTLELIIDASEVKSMDEEYPLDTNNFFDEPGTDDDDLSYIFYVQTLGDFNLNNELDGSDIDDLLNNWKTGNYGYELGPVSGDAPHFEPQFDGDWNLDDLMTFIRTWNWLYYDNHFPRSKPNISITGIPPMMEVVNNQVLMKLPDYEENISRIWYHIEGIEGEVEINSTSANSNFDLALKTGSRKHILEKHLANFSTKPIYSNISLGNILPGTINPLELKIHYEIKSLDSVLSSGVSTLQYSPVPEEYKLKQPYPNPFNPIANVEYALPNNSEIVLSVFDIQGRLATYLAKGHHSAGYYKTIWDGSQHSSGAYFIRLRAYDSQHRLQFSKMQKIILVK